MLPRPLRPFARFEARDHLGDTGRPIADNARAVLAEHGLAADRILLLTCPRVAGHVFNPLSVFYCFARTPDGAEAVVAVIAEVHNTYGGRHVYLLRPDDAGRDTVDKVFYVSPFLPMGGSYLMRTPVPGRGAVGLDRAAAGWADAVRRHPDRAGPADQHPDGAGAAGPLAVAHPADRGADPLAGHPAVAAQGAGAASSGGREPGRARPLSLDRLNRDATFGSFRGLGNVRKWQVELLNSSVSRGAGRPRSGSLGQRFLDHPASRRHVAVGQVHAMRGVRPRGRSSVPSRDASRCCLPSRSRSRPPAPTHDRRPHRDRPSPEHCPRPRRVRPAASRPRCRHWAAPCRASVGCTRRPCPAASSRPGSASSGPQRRRPARRCRARIRSRR